VSSGSESTDPPGAVSNQNQEEAEGAHADRGRPDSGGRSNNDAPEQASRQPSPGGGEDSVPGTATEGSQATGHPENAG
jgi:hypothetical protein